MHKQQPWQKKGDTTFDVIMGSYDGAEACELVGSSLLSQLQKLNINIGLYRYDGLAISNTTPRDTENIKKEICRVFNHNGLRITIEANKQTINFLDITFNLKKTPTSPSQSLTPHYKTSTARATTHQPPQITYPPASTKDCHSFHLTKHPSTKQKKKKHSTNADTSILYTTNQPRLTTEKTGNGTTYSGTTPPFSKNVSTNIGHRFLALVDKHFPKDHKLRKIFNRNTIKISYSCMNNTKQVIYNYNKRI